MSTRIGELESTVEVTDASSATPSDSSASESGGSLDRRTRARQHAKRERARVARTFAEGFSD